jgi:hypothetical protein
MLGFHGVKHLLIDANIEGLLHVIQGPLPSEEYESVWTRRAFRNRERNLAAMRDPGLYRQIDRYARAVRDISRVLGKVSAQGEIIGLADYAHHDSSPLRSSDLLAAAENPELNPFYPYFSTRLRTLFHEQGFHAAGISVNYLSQALCTFAIIGFIRREFPKLKVILGGGLVTSWMKSQLWSNPFSGLADCIVEGPGEKQLFSFLGLDVILEKTYRPDYKAFPISSYLSPCFILPYSASSGCYWNKCAFCPEKAEDSLYLPVPTRRVIEDIRILAQETSPGLVHLLDNAISPSLLDAISKENLPVPWYGFARVDSRLSSPDFCMSLKRSGCVMLKLGIESGDQGVLDRLRKGIILGDASSALKNLTKAGIKTYVYLIFGTPEETEESARKTLEFTVKHSGFISFLNLAIFNMPLSGASYPGVRTKKFYDGDLSLYTDFIHPGGWNRRRVRLFLDHEFRKHPAVSAILRRNPPVFTSNHAPFF